MSMQNIFYTGARQIKHMNAQSVFISKLPIFITCYDCIHSYDAQAYVNQLVNITNGLYDHINTLYRWLFTLSKKYPEHIEKFLHVIEVACNNGCHADLIDTLGNDLITCLKRFPNLISDGFYKNVENIIIPQVEAGNSIFAFMGTRWFDEHKQKGGTGLADFSYKCYALPVMPAGLHELVQMYKEVLAGNFELFEQIRKDAILIGHHGVFGHAVGDMIHNNDHNTKNLITSMLLYYETADKKNLAMLQNKIDFDISRVFDLNNYDHICENGEKTICVLQRLNNNMNEAKLYLPNVKDNVLQNKICLLENNLNTKNLEDVLQILNTSIISCIEKHQIGISPSIIQCCVWLDAKVTRWLNGLDFEYQFALNSYKVFKEILLFNELLNNPDTNFNQADFEKFYFDNVISNPPEIAFRAVAQRQNELSIKLNNFHNLLKNVYSIDDNIVFDRKQRIWSGNMFGALQRLLPYKKASTIIGQRYKKDREELDANMYSIISSWNSLIK